ncbi:Arc family DNA-binding protein [Ancylobacter oerskovii]|uniref:Arc family DNA-binding protein n=1 Tax=Ancylobacter oerskovii TaxID=459519 RepID=A0ABW4Z1C3_9HYPH|nr:Arc family DNA-binding protein [Ancylobacter oerskovii]MBS7542519.1 Arc family DNA-binding protein [Ancylobacter oerskovii]
MSAKKPKDEKIGNIAPFGLRMMPDLRERIEAAARENGRSMNAEIVARLEASFEAEEVDEQSRYEADFERYAERIAQDAAAKAAAQSLQLVLELGEVSHDRRHLRFKPDAVTRLLRYLQGELDIADVGKPNEDTGSVQAAPAGKK